jgi:hypothetical protein
MRVAPNELTAVSREGMLIRYAILGPVAFVVVDLPDTGTAGTDLEAPCRIEHHGIVVKGELTLVRAGRVPQVIGPEIAFHVRPGTPRHHFETASAAVIAGFVPVDPGMDVSSGALAAQGYEPVSGPRRQAHLPRTVRIRDGDARVRRKGRFEAEGSVMGPWLLMRSAFRPGDFSGGWCEVPHWGLVLDGAVAINYRGSVELVSAGDAFYADPGHQFETPDGATIVDYTPVAELDGTHRAATWRRPALAKAGFMVDDAGPDVAARPDDREPGPSQRDHPGDEVRHGRPKSAMTSFVPPGPRLRRPALAW